MHEEAIEFGCLRTNLQLYIYETMCNIPVSVVYELMYRPTCTNTHYYEYHTANNFNNRSMTSSFLLTAMTLYFTNCIHSQVLTL